MLERFKSEFKFAPIFPFSVQGPGDDSASYISGDGSDYKKGTIFISFPIALSVVCLSTALCIVAKRCT